MIKVVISGVMPDGNVIEEIVDGVQSFNWDDGWFTLYVNGARRWYNPDRIWKVLVSHEEN